MWPLVIIAAVTAAAQLYQSQQAKGANQATLDKIRADFEKVKPPNLDVSIDSPPDYIKTQIQQANFNPQSLTPEQFKVVGQYVPELVPQVLEKQPELLKETAATTAGKDAQMAALQKLRQVSKGGFDPEFQANVAAAQRAAGAQAQSRSQSILQDSERRGTLNSGAQLAAQLQGASDASQRNAASGEDAAVTAYKSQLQALRDSASLGGQISQQDLAQQGTNAGIINAFNQRQTAGQRDFLNNRADTLNNAQKLNLGAAQDVSNRNTASTNQFALDQQSRQDSLQKYLAQIRQQEQDRQNDIVGKQAAFSQAEKQRVAGNQQRNFSNDMDVQAGKNGILREQMGMNTQNAQDNNNAIQGFGNAAVSGYQYGQQQDSGQAAQDRADARARYAKTGYWTQDEEDAAKKKQSAGYDGYDYGSTT